VFTTAEIGGPLPLALKLFRGTRGIDIHSPTSTVETDIAIDQSKNGIVATKPDVLARQEFRSTLADNDVSGDNQLAAKFFHTEPFANAIPAVFNAALSFFMSHDGK
jgi:hypothetical protein